MTGVQVEGQVERVAYTRQVLTKADGRRIVYLTAPRQWKLRHWRIRRRRLVAMLAEVAPYDEAYLDTARGWRKIA